MTTRTADMVKAINQLEQASTETLSSHKREIEDVKAENDDLRERLEEIEAKGSQPGRIGGDRQTPELKAFETYLREPSDTHKSALADLQRKDMSIGVGADGGVGVPEVIANEIISRAIARSPLIGIVRDTTTSTSDYKRLLNLRGATAAWVSETGTRSDTSTPLLREIAFTHGELAAVPVATNWSLNDIFFDVGRFLSEQVADVFAKSLETAILTGSGTNQPTGLMNTDPVATDDGASPERDQDAIEFVTGTSDLADDLISLFFTLKPEYRRNATWVMSSASLAEVRKLRDTNGSGFLWQADLSGGVDSSDGTLLGKRVVTSEDMSLVGQSPANNSILCGDFNVGYELVRIGGMSLIVDQVTTKGSTKFYTAARFGGRLVDNDGIKVLQA